MRPCARRRPARPRARRRPESGRRRRSPRRRRGRSRRPARPRAANTLGDLAADPARGPRDQRDPALQQHCAQVSSDPHERVGDRRARVTRGSPSPTSTARSSSTAACSGSSCAGGGCTRSREIREIVGVPEATGVRHRDARASRAATSRSSCSSTRAASAAPGARRPCDYGTGHFCVFVDGHRRALRRPLGARRRVPLGRARSR